MLIGKITNSNIFILLSYSLLVELPNVVKQMVDIEIPVKMGTAGRAQIPLEIREKLNINDGDYLLIRIEKIIKSKDYEKEATA